MTLKHQHKSTIKHHKTKFKGKSPTKQKQKTLTSNVPNSYPKPNLKQLLINNPLKQQTHNQKHKPTH